MNELTLGLRIKVNDDGSVQVLNKAGDAIGRVSQESAGATHHLSDMGDKAAPASQRIIDGMSRASAATQKTAQSAREAASSIDAGMASAASAVQSKMAVIEQSIHAASAASRADMTAMTVSSAASSAALANTETASKGVVSVMSMLRGAVPIAVLAGLGKEAFDVNREFQSLRTSLASSVGGAENAKIAFGFVQDFAAKTPYDVEQVTESFIRLKNLGLSPSEEALRSYGNTAASQSKPLMQMIEAVADASVGEFERLKEFGIKASQENGKVAFTFQGVTTTVANNAGEIQKYLINLGNSKFGDAMAGQSKTINGALSNLGDTWKAFMDRLADDNQENAIAKWVTNAGNAIHWLDVQINGAVTNADKLAEIDRRISANQKSLNAHNANGWVGGLIDDLSGYDAQLKKNQIESDTKAREQLVKAMGAQKSAQDALIGSMANSTNATNASSEAIKKEIESLNDQHKKLSLSERDYELAKLSALGMGEVEKKIAIGIWDTNHALEEKQKASKQATEETKRAAKEEQTLWEKALNFLKGQAEQLNLTKLTGRERALETEITRNLNAVLGESYDRTKVYSAAKQNLIDEVRQNTTAIFDQTEAEKQYEEALRRVNTAQDEFLKQQYALDDLSMDTKFAQRDLEMAKTLRAMGAQNDYIKRRIDLEKQIREMQFANPGLDAQAVRDAVIASQKAEVELKKYTGESAAWMEKAFGRAIENIQDNFAGMFENMLNGSATESFDKFAQNIRQTLNKAIGQQLALDLQNLFGENGSLINVFKSGLLFALAAIPGFFKESAPAMTSSPAMGYQKSDVMGTGAMAIADTFSRHLGYQFQTQTIVEFNKSLDMLAGNLMAGVKLGIDQLASLPVVQQVASKLNPVTSFFSKTIGTVAVLSPPL